MSETIGLEQLTSWMRSFQERILAQHEYLTELDARVGDADHGSNMVRGVNAVMERLEAEPPESVGEFGKTVGMTFVGSVGGASGPLYGTFFLRVGVVAEDRTELDCTDLIRVLGAGARGVQRRGKAQLGDKTMVDVLLPAIAAAESAAQAVDGGPAGRVCAGGLFAVVVNASVVAAQQAVESSKKLVARKGRASYLGDRSAGHIDPGSVSSLLLFQALADVVSGVKP